MHVEPRDTPDAVAEMIRSEPRGGLIGGVVRLDVHSDLRPGEVE